MPLVSCSLCLSGIGRRCGGATPTEEQERERNSGGAGRTTVLEKVPTWVSLESIEAKMVAVVARQGRQLQRYTSNGRRKVVGCIPYKFRADCPDANAIDQRLEVLVISSQKSHEIMFPKGGWERDESIEEAASREAMEEAGVRGHVQTILGNWWYKNKLEDTHKLGYMFPLKVTEEMLHWPEMGSRKRRWVTIAEAKETCKQQWMKEALARLVDRLSQ